MTDGWEEVKGPEGREHVTDIGKKLLFSCPIGWAMTHWWSLSVCLSVCLSRPWP